MVQNCTQGRLSRFARYRETAGPALEALASILPGWEADALGDLRGLAELRDRAGSSRPPSLEDIRDLEEVREVAEQYLGDVRALHAAVFVMRAKFDAGLFSDLPQVARWPDYVEELADGFVRAMASTNRKTVGLGNSGPLARFLVAIIPLISGETPTADTVMRYLQRKAKKQ
jgi:hypothetical protein